uniref:Uncharacterized protein n=1 Tax=Arion vulgaris TaxID=1028688 RepID=A0A0B7AIP8_9EUPU
MPTKNVAIPAKTNPVHMQIFLDLLVPKMGIVLFPIVAQNKDPNIRNKAVNETSSPVSCTENFRNLLKNTGK